MRLSFDLVDQAYGKQVQTQRVELGPIKDIESRSTEALEAQLAELTARHGPKALRE